MKNFKPLKGANESVDIKELKYPLFGSDKRDGVRLIFKDGLLLSSHLKEVPNVQLHKWFKPISDYSKNYNIIFDGEIFDENITFYDTVSIFRSLDKVISPGLTFHCFDCVIDEQYSMPFNERYNIYKTKILPYFYPVEQIMIYSVEEAQVFFDQSMSRGRRDGIILRSAIGKYKFGRATNKEGIIFKIKPYITLDGEIILVYQATEVDPTAEKTVNEMGYSVTSKKKADRILIERASAFGVIYKEHNLKVSLAMTNEEKCEVWKNKSKYIGRWIEYKGMLEGSKDVPKHCELIRFRDDKE
jgi:hypothetical protein